MSVRLDDERWLRFGEIVLGALALMIVSSFSSYLGQTPMWMVFFALFWGRAILRGADLMDLFLWTWPMWLLMVVSANQLIKIEGVILGLGFSRWWFFALAFYAGILLRKVKDVGSAMFFLALVWPVCLAMAKGSFFSAAIFFVSATLWGYFLSLYWMITRDGKISWIEVVGLYFFLVIVYTQ